MNSVKAILLLVIIVTAVTLLAAYISPRQDLTGKATQSSKQDVSALFNQYPKGFITTGYLSLSS